MAIPFIYNTVDFSCTVATEDFTVGSRSTKNNALKGSNTTVSASWPLLAHHSVLIEFHSQTPKNLEGCRKAHHKEEWMWITADWHQAQEPRSIPSSATDLLLLPIPLFPFATCKATGITKFFKWLGQKYKTGQQEDTHIYCHIFLLRNLAIYRNLKVTTADSNEARRRNHAHLLSLQEGQFLTNQVYKDRCFGTLEQFCSKFLSTFAKCSRGFTKIKTGAIQFFFFRNSTMM